MPLLLLVLGLVAAVVVWPFVEAGLSRQQRALQMATVRDIWTVGRAVQSYWADHSVYPSSPDGSVAALRPALVPTYMSTLPETDAWGYPLEYFGGGHAGGTWQEAEPYTIVSHGRDGRSSGPSTGMIERFEDDLIFSTGSWIAYPDIMGK